MNFWLPFLATILPTIKPAIVAIVTGSLFLASETRRITREFNKGEGRCKDALAIVRPFGIAVWLLSVGMLYLFDYAAHPAIFWATFAFITLYGLGGTMQVVGELQERLRWLGPPKPPEDEHRN